MRSVTLAQAALFAALAMALLAGCQLIDNFALIRDTPALVLLGSTVPSIVWAGFFFMVYRSVHGNASSARAAAWIALVFAVLLEAIVVNVRFHRAVNYWTPFGNALSLWGWLFRLGWAVFLIAFALAPEHVPGGSRTRQIALLLAILAAPSALSAAYHAFDNGIGFLFGDIPMQAMWRALITPVIRTVYWLSQILFLWTVWGKPQTRDPIEASSLRLTP